MYKMPNSRIRTALERIADALMKEPGNPAEAGGDRVAFALERIATWCENANEIWEKMTDEETEG